MITYHLCSKVKQRFNEAKLKGYTSIIMTNISNIQIEELSECGYIVKKHVIGEEINYIISENNIYNVKKNKT